MPPETTTPSRRQPFRKSNLLSPETFVPPMFDDMETALKKLHDYVAAGRVEKLTANFFHHLSRVDVDDDEPLIDKGDAHDNYTPLILAAKNGLMECVTVLCVLGNVNIDKKAGWNETTALMKAAEKGHDETVETLIELGADINLTNSFGNTALMLAAEYGKAGAVEVLLSYYETIEKDVMNTYQYTALILAAENGHKDCAQLLIDNGADLNLRNMFGKTALIMAAENGHCGIVELLCKEAPKDVNIRSNRGVSALMLASVKGNWDVVKCLTSYGADIHVENNDKSDNALTMACLGGKAMIVMHLVDLGAQVHYRNVNKETVLMKACAKGNREIMDYLLSHYTTGIDILASLTAQDKDGNTCLMRACSTGNLQVMIYLMEKLQEQLTTNSADMLKNINRSGDTTELARLLYYYPTTYYFIKACYRYITNKDGDTAMTLLSKYYRENPKKFNDFVIQATSGQGRMYLFDMLPSIFPNFISPNTVLNGCKVDLFQRLRAQVGYASDMKLLSAFVNIAASLKLAAERHPLESREMDELFEKVEGAIKACMLSNAMDVPANVTKILYDMQGIHDDKSDIVCQALAFVNGPLELCIKHHLTGLLGAAQICTHVHTVFNASLRPMQRTVIRELPDIFQVRSGCTTFRYRPAFMFLLEGVSKAFYLGLVAYVSAEDCGSEAECVLSTYLSNYEIVLVVMVTTGLMFELGEVLNRSSIVLHFSDVWNVLDVVSNGLVMFWLCCRLYPSQHNLARGFLAISAVPMSIGLLRFLSTFQYLGQLVIVIFAMSQDLGAFLFVFLVSILGFGIAFHSLFPDREEFQGFSTTFLTLFNAALGDHNFESFNNHRYQYVGICIMALYVMFVTIILLNLIVAQMSSTFQKMNEKSFEQWSMVMAKNVQDWLMLSEKTNPLCMLPPPLNAVSTLMWPWDLWERQKKRHDEEIPSICGSISDIVIGLITAPVCAALEVYLVNAELWSSQVPRRNALFVTVLSIFLFPMWYLLFFVAILSNIFYNLEWTRISKRTNRIIYETQSNSSNIFLRYFIINAVFILFSPLWLCYFFDVALGDVFKLEREKLMTKQVLEAFADKKTLPQVSYQRETNLQRKEKATKLKNSFVSGSGGSTAAPSPSQQSPKGSFMLSKENKFSMTAIAALTATVPELENNNRFSVTGLGQPLPWLTQSEKQNDNNGTMSDMSVKSTTGALGQKSSTSNASTDSIAELISQATIILENDLELSNRNPTGNSKSREFNQNDQSGVEVFPSTDKQSKVQSHSKSWDKIRKSFNINNLDISTAGSENASRVGSPNKGNSGTNSPRIQSLPSPRATMSEIIHDLPPKRLFPRGGIHLYEENAVKVFFFITAPVWLSSILLIQLFGLIVDSFRPRAKKANAFAYDPTHPNPVQNTESARGSIRSGVVLPVPATKAFANTVSADASEADDVEQLSATKGKLEVKLMRLNFQGQVGLFGRRANTYVKATYGSKSLVSPTVLYDPSAPLTYLFRFDLTNRNSIKFQVFDKDFTDSTFVGDRGQSAGVMMAEEIVDIRPWIANGRFEGDIKLHRGGGDTFQAGLKLQLNVKLTYPGRKRMQKYLVGSAGVLALNPPKEILHAAATAKATTTAATAKAMAAAENTRDKSEKSDLSMTPRHKTRIPRQEDSFFPTAERAVKTAEEGNDDAPSNHPPTQGILSVIPPSSAITMDHHHPAAAADTSSISPSPKSFQSVSGHSSNAPSMDLKHRFNNLHSVADGVSAGVGSEVVDGVPPPPLSSKSSKQDGSDADSLAISSLITTVFPSKSTNQGSLNPSNNLSDEGHGFGKSVGQRSAGVDRPISSIEKAFCYGDDNDEETIKLTLPASVNANTKSVVAAVINTTLSTSTITTPDASPSKLGSILSITSKRDSILSTGGQSLEMRAAFVPAAQMNNKNITTVTTITNNNSNNKQHEETATIKAPLDQTGTTLSTKPQGKTNITNNVILDDDDDNKREPLFQPDERDRMFLFLTEEVESSESKSPESALTAAAAAAGTKEKNEKTDKSAKAITEICCPICHGSKLINIPIVEAITPPSSSALVTTK